MLLALLSGTIGVGVVGGNFSKPDLAVMILFLGLLPVLNAFLDWGSWWVSRTLGEKILHDRSRYRVLVHTILDGAVALILLVLLTSLLGAVIGAAEKLYPEGYANLHLTEIMKKAAMDPLGYDGFWITAMLFSTLIPTALHFCVASLAFLDTRLITDGRRKKLIQLLKMPNPSRKSLNPVAHHIALTYSAAIPASLAIFAVLAYGLVRLLGVVAPFLLHVGLLSVEVVQYFL